METKGFTSYLESKNHSKYTQEGYIKCVKKFLLWYKPDPINCIKKDILDYLEYLKNRKGQQNRTRAMSLLALKHYFSFLLKAGQINTNPCNFIKIRGQKRKTLYKIYTPEELDTLFDNYYNVFIRTFDDSKMHKYQRKQAQLCRERNALILSILINQGVTTGEVERIELGDVDLIKATIKILGGRHSNERTMPLKATQIGLFLNYMQNIRPQFVEYQTNESEKLFLSLPTVSCKTAKNDITTTIFSRLTNQLKSIDKQFINFKQIRASLITSRLKIYDLRKTQYLAGHRYVSSTESYQVNNLDNLIDDINKLHPF